MDKTRIHIIKRGDGWAIKKEGGLKASRVFDKKEDAEEHSRRYRNDGYDVIVHRKDGSIEKWEKAIG
jgi:hypothetical protein